MGIKLCAALAAALFMGCGGDGGKSQSPDAKAVDAFASQCGKPGDLGNELGIGKFCASLSDCSSTAMAKLCSTIGDSTTHFCTKTCTMGSTDQCGTATSCVCNGSNQCGCTPMACL